MSDVETDLLLADDSESRRVSQWREGVERTRALARFYTSSKWGHYTVIILTTIDVGCIFADFILSLYLCEHEPYGKRL